MEEKNYSKVPVFENGLAQPVFKFTDGKTGEKYDPATSSIVRYCVYVESDYDMDGDGKRDLVKAFIQVPRSAVEGSYKAATLYEARPYCAGVQADGYDHMKEVESKEYCKFDFADLDKEVPARIPEGTISAMDLALKADPADWYYPDKGNNNSMVYENLDNFNYYLVRGFAVVVSAGFGALGSDGFNYVGSEYERDAFKSVVEWLHGDRDEGRLGEWECCHDRKILCRNHAVCSCNHRRRRPENNCSGCRYRRLVYTAEYAGCTALLAERDAEQFPGIFLFQPL